MSAPPTLLPNSLVLDDRFRVLSSLGGGGMGEVYLAEQVSLGRKVALKVLRQDIGLQPGMSERFRREALLLSSVDHPAVVRVIDFGQSANATCLVMELAEGETLAAALTRGRFPPSRARLLLTQLAEGLVAIHAKGIIHRDLKPENVVLSTSVRGDQARLLDFGIARLVDPGVGSDVSQVGLVLGTPEYISPEQGMGGVLDARSDLYAFGVLAYQVLSGALPFPGPSPREFMAQHVTTAPTPLLARAPHLMAFPQLVALVMKCLQKEPPRRPGSAAELLAALEALPPFPPDAPEKVFVPPTGGTALFGSTGPGLPRASSPSAPALRTQNLTVMLTDIKGFTERTSRQTREENARMLDLHDRLLLPVMRAFKGKLVQKRGDALLVTFESPTEGVLCGMAMQDRLWRNNQAAPSEAERMLVRIVLHAGEMVVTDNGLVGEPLEVIEKVEGEADAGEVVFTEAVRLAMNRAEAPCEPRGSLTMPGSTEELKLYRCVPSGAGPPFGGRDEAKSPRLSSSFARWRRGAQDRSQALLSRVERAFGSLRGPPRASGIPSPLAHFLEENWLPLLGVVALIVGGIFAATFIKPSLTSQARKKLELGQPQEALKLVQPTLAPEKSSPEVVRTHAAILHALKKHDEELRTLGPSDQPQGAEDDALVLTGLAEDFGRTESAAVRAYLEGLPRDPLRRALTRFVAEPESEKQWGALRFLDVTEQLPPIELQARYVRWLEIKGLKSQDLTCHARSLAAQRLGVLGAREAIPALKRLAQRKHNMFHDCGQAEANTALRALGDGR